MKRLLIVLILLIPGLALAQALQWNYVPNPSVPVTLWVTHCGTQSGVYTTISGTSVTSPSATSFVIPINAFGFAPGTYYCVIQAAGATAWSLPSKEVSFSVVAPPPVATPPSSPTNLTVVP